MDNNTDGARYSMAAWELALLDADLDALARGSTSQDTRVCEEANDSIWKLARIPGMIANLKMQKGHPNLIGVLRRKQRKLAQDRGLIRGGLIDGGDKGGRPGDAS